MLPNRHSHSKHLVVFCSAQGLDHSSALCTVHRIATPVGMQSQDELIEGAPDFNPDWDHLPDDDDPLSFLRRA
jgi:hypothetical protein